MKYVTMTKQTLVQLLGRCCHDSQQIRIYDAEVIRLSCVELGLTPADDGLVPRSVKTNLNETMDAIRGAMARFDGGEQELYEYLMSEAEGWKMRLQELEDDDDNSANKI